MEEIVLTPEELSGIETISAFMKWTADNTYLFSYRKNNNTYGWLTHRQIMDIDDMQERDRLRLSTEELYKKFKADKNWIKW
jgi:hypothetical protein